MATFPDGSNFIAPLIGESLIERFAMVRKPFEQALLIGAHDKNLVAVLRAQIPALTIIEAGARLAKQCHALNQDVEQILLDEPCDGSLGEPQSIPPKLPKFDVIIWPGGLESIDDVPQILRCLRTRLKRGGLIIGALIGDGSFPLLRRLLTSDALRPIARMHPQISLRTMGDVLQYCGFALPVVDVENYHLDYRDWRDIIRDLRATGLAGQLAHPPPPLQRCEVTTLDRVFHAQALVQAGQSPAQAQATLDKPNQSNQPHKATEILRIIYFHGWESSSASSTPNPTPSPKR